MTEYKTYTYQELDEMPTLHQGHFGNLKVQSDTQRQWLDRTPIGGHLDTSRLSGDRLDAILEATSRLAIVEELTQGKWVAIGVYIAEGEDDGFTQERQSILTEQKAYYDLQG